MKLEKCQEIVREQFNIHRGNPSLNGIEKAWAEAEAKEPAKHARGCDVKDCMKPATVTSKCQGYFCKAHSDQKIAAWFDEDRTEQPIICAACGFPIAADQPRLESSLISGTFYHLDPCPKPPDAEAKEITTQRCECHGLVNYPATPPRTIVEGAGPLIHCSHTAEPIICVNCKQPIAIGNSYIGGRRGPRHVGLCDAPNCPTPLKGLPKYDWPEIPDPPFAIIGDIAQWDMTMRVERLEAVVQALVKAHNKEV